MSSQHLSNLPAATEIAAPEPFIAVVFTRHNLHLHTLLLENQPGSALENLGV